MINPRKVDDVPYPPELCARCKAEKLLCGRSKCPILEKFYISTHLAPLKELNGSSPPSVFVGSRYYPKVNIGPAAPNEHGDTSKYESEENLVKMDLEDIVKLRYSLYRGYKVLQATDARSPNAYLSDLHDLILISRPTDIELDYLKFNENLHIDANSQPFGPGGIIRKFHHEHGSTDRSLEKVYYDTDLRAQDAIIYLRENQIPLNTIQKLLSLGMLGDLKFRKLVPTRWAITATDNTLSDHYQRKLMEFDQIDSMYYFEQSNFGNNYFILIFPWSYVYENIEVWGFGSVWVGNRGLSIEEEYEDSRRKVRSPSMGGSFFASKLPILEYLNEIEKSAGFIVIRYVTGEYYIPVGVWQVRENIRAALKYPKPIDSIDNFFDIVKMRTGIDFKYHSKIYRMIKTQRKLGV